MRDARREALFGGRFDVAGQAVVVAVDVAVGDKRAHAAPAVEHALVNEVKDAAAHSHAAGPHARRQLLLRRQLLAGLQHAAGDLLTDGLADLGVEGDSFRTDLRHDGQAPDVTIIDGKMYSQSWEDVYTSYTYILMDGRGFVKMGVTHFLKWTFCKLHVQAKSTHVILASSNARQ
jgi:hypothetical protein